MRISQQAYQSDNFIKFGFLKGNQEMIISSQDNGTSVLNNGVWSDWLGADGNGNIY